MGVLKKVGVRFIKQKYMNKYKVFLNTIITMIVIFKKTTITKKWIEY